MLGAEIARQQGGAIGPEAEIRGMAEAHHAAHPHHQVQAHGEEHEDQDFRGHAEAVVADHDGQQQEQQRPARRRRCARRREPPERDEHVADRRARVRVRPAQQAPGPHDQHHRHHQEHEHQTDLGKQQDAEGIELRDDDRRQEGAGHAAQPADHHHHEGLHDDRQVHGVMHRLARDLHRAAEAGKKDAEREHAGEQPGLVDPERRHHGAILGRGPHQDAPARLVEQQPQQPQHHRAEADQQEIIGRKPLAEDVDGTLQPGRPRPQQVLRPPDHHDEVLHHQGQPEGGEQLEQFRRFIDAPQQRRLDQRPDERHDEGRDDHAAIVAERPGELLGQGEGEVGPDHVERAVGEVHDARHAENDRQPRGHQKQRRRAGEPVQELNEQKIHDRSPAPFVTTESSPDSPPPLSWPGLTGPPSNHKRRV
jgi:hypothetical protein